MNLQATLETVQHDMDHALKHRITGDNRLAEAMRYAAIGGGKRLRAALTLAVADMLGADRANAVAVAAAIECAHAQSLIHDDLPCMDDDDLRRGKPTVHKQFDEATAVLAGDALLALAFEILADPATHDEAAVRAELVLSLARTLGHQGLAVGQMMDLFPDPNPTPETVFVCEILKTGGLIRYAVDAGALIAGASTDDRARLSNYADRLGLAFQIRDDILDAIGDDQVLGKAAQKDSKVGRKNAVAVLGLQGAKDEAERLKRECCGTLAAFGSKAKLLEQVAEFAISRSH